MDTFTVEAIGIVRGGRAIPEDDDWGASRARIELDPARFTSDALTGLDAFSHAEIVFVFDRVDSGDVTCDAIREPAWAREIIRHYR